MSRIWEAKNNVAKLKLLIEEDENVGFYLIVYPLGSAESIKDHLCDDFEEALLEAFESYGVQKDIWTQTI